MPEPARRFTRLRPWRRDGLWDVTARGGAVVAFGPHAGSPAPAGTEDIDCGGRAMLPPFADVHVHLDKTLVDATNESGTLREAIRRWGAIKKTLAREDFRARAHRAIRMATSRGCARLRTHVDVSPWKGGLDALEAILEVREQVAPRVVLQVVALGNPGASRADDDAMREALRLGADFVGGCPALAPDMGACVRAAFDLAEEFGRGLDLHVDETEDPAKLSLELIADATFARGMQGRVVAGHCCSLDFVDEATAARVIAKVAEARVDVVTLPSCNLVLMGRGMHPAPRGLTRVAQLRAAGVRVAAASDNVRDPFNPLGCYDPVKIASLLCHAVHMTSDGEQRACIEMVSSVPGAIMGLGPGLPGVGDAADFVVMDIEESGLVLAENPPVWRLVVAGEALSPSAVAGAGAGTRPGA